MTRDEYDRIVPRKQQRNKIRQKKRGKKSLYVLVQHEFRSETDIDTYITINNQFSFGIANNNPYKCTVAGCDSIDENHTMRRVYLKCTCRQKACTLR